MKNKRVHFQMHQKSWKRLIQIYITLTCACLLHKIVWVDFEFFVCFLRWFFKRPCLLWFSGAIPIMNHYCGSWYYLSMNKTAYEQLIPKTWHDTQVLQYKTNMPKSNHTINYVCAYHLVNFCISAFPLSLVLMGSNWTITRGSFAHSFIFTCSFINHY